MALRVVELLEAVEVEQQQRERVPEAHGALLLDLEALEEVALVVEARELVGDREAFSSSSRSRRSVTSLPTPTVPRGRAVRAAQPRQREAEPAALAALRADEHVLADDLLGRGDEHVEEALARAPVHVELGGVAAEPLERDALKNCSATSLNSVTRPASSVQTMMSPPSRGGSGNGPLRLERPHALAESLGLVAPRDFHAVIVQ